MGRPPGRRNPGYEERRRAIARRLLERLSHPEGAKASLRDLAQASGVSVSTLRHYFGDRKGALQAAIAEVHVLAEPWLQIAASDKLELPVQESLGWFFRLFVEGWHNGVGAMVSESLSAGTGNSDLGRSAVQDVLEPTLQAIEARLAHHRDRGELHPEMDARHAALGAFSPVLVALLHQHTWSGASCRPLDVSSFIESHVETFVRGWAPARTNDPV